jgi:glycerol-3-phosphate dehydrogenase
MSNDPRPALVERLAGSPPFDLVVIGGGATGLGVAVDAAARGLSVALFEADDFAKGTSSRATKLLHGGVRYLAQGNIGLVREALQERGTVLRNAPHLAHPLAFVMPLYGARGAWIDRWFYGAGLKAYDWLAAREGLADTEHLGRARTAAAVPGVRRDRLVGGIRYWDGQFDDARLALALARTAEDLGTVVLNRCRVTGLLRQATGHGRVAGVVVEELERGHRFEVGARCVVNATGVWVDAVRRLDDPGSRKLVSPSQGIHLVVDSDFLPGDQALLIPRTGDGRVLFAVPWLGKVVLGTTDTPREDLALEPRPLAEEIAFVLNEASRYLERAPQLADVRSLWGGLRPLVRPGDEAVAVTKSLSREHTVLVSPTGLVTVTGGKWTTYRAMAEDVLEICMTRAGLPTRPAGRTRNLPLHGAGPGAMGAGKPDPYGSDGAAVAALPGAGRWLAPGLSEAMVRFAVRHEFARQVEDVLARRNRLLFLDARAAAAAAPAVAAVMADELGPGFAAAASTQAFIALAHQYLPQAVARMAPAGDPPATGPAHETGAPATHGIAST